MLVSYRGVIYNRLRLCRFLDEPLPALRCIETRLQMMRKHVAMCVIQIQAPKSKPQFKMGATAILSTVLRVNCVLQYFGSLWQSPKGAL
jgi:hypothetical protein